MQTLSLPQLDAVQFITDDTAAKQFLVDHNQLQHMIPPDPFDHVAVVFCTEDAYCLAANDVGHPNQEDNGYTVLIIPKWAMSPRDAAAIISAAREAGKLYPDCEEVQTIETCEPEVN